MAPESELGVVIRFLDEGTADVVRNMLDDEGLELSVEMDSGGAGTLGWVTVGDQHYRGKLVQLPTTGEVFTQENPQLHTKSFDVTEVLIVARAPDVKGGRNEATLEVEMTPARHPDGLTSTTQNIREHFDRIQDAIPLAPSDTEIQALLAEAQWLETMKEDPRSTFSVEPAPAE